MPNKDTKFKPGQSGNSKGRPKGSRHKLSEAFVSALYDDFIESGAETIRKLREKDAIAYARVIASVIPRNIDVTGHVHQTHEHRAVSQADERISELLTAGQSISAEKAVTH